MYRDAARDSSRDTAGCLGLAAVFDELNVSGLDTGIPAVPGHYSTTESGWRA
jgi:hypothetical protein